MTNSADAGYMRRALELAQRGWGRVAPNPLVGAVVVDGQGIAGEGWHQQYGGPHAEVRALGAAGTRAGGGTLYVTLEPCSHHGKTPPCTDAILASGVRRVVFACPDPNPTAMGGADVLTGAGLEVLGGVEEHSARDQNAPFFHALTDAARPWTALKLALSLDAAVADGAGQSRWITGPSARAETHRLRAGFDAIGVGIGTALADDPLLTVRGTVRPRKPPLRVVFDHHLRLPLDSALVRSARELPLCLVCDPGAKGAQALEAAGARVFHAVDTADGLAQLRGAGVTSLLCEGGSGLAAALLAGDCIDRMYLFFAPVLLGAGAKTAFGALESQLLRAAPRWRNLGVARFDADTLLTFAR